MQGQALAARLPTLATTGSGATVRDISQTLGATRVFGRHRNLQSAVRDSGRDQNSI